MEIALLDVSAVTGLCAMVTLTVNVLFGMLLSTGYKASRWWKKLPIFLRKMNIRRLHNQTAYLALLLVLVHPVLLVFDKDTKFRLADIVFPALTTVAQPTAHMAETAGAIMLRALEDPVDRVEQIMLETKLIVPPPCLAITMPPVPPERITS